MDMDVVRKAGMSLEVWVRDLGAFDPYRIFLDGIMFGPYFENETHLTVSGDITDVVVQFEGEDSGASAIVDAAVTPPARLARQKDGASHRYSITAEV